jgi:predicted transposase YdaD
LNLKTTLEVSQNIDQEDRELIMRLSPLYTQRLEEAERRGQIEGERKGEKQGQRKVVENLLKIRFGLLDEQLSTIIERLLSLPIEEFTPLLLQLSREELLERFGQSQ